MFVFDANEEIDISQYEYELYNSGTVSGTYPNNTFSEQPVSTGFSASNVFTVSVTNSTKNDAGVVTSRSYIGRVRAKDTSGNPSVWSPVVQTDNSTPLISSQVVDTLTASKITAGTIGAHTITMAGANSIIKSSTFDGTAVGDGSYSGGTQGWLINGSGKAYFYDATIVGSLDIGGFDSGSFHVDTSGNMWLGSGSFSTAPFKVSSSGSVTSINGTIGGFTISSDKLLAGSGSNQITLSTGIYNATTNPDELVIAVGGNLSAGFGVPFAVNSSGVMNANVATVGPLQLDSSGLTSQYFNSDNYIRLNTSGDFYKNAKRGTYYYLTYMLGELLQIKRTNNLGVPTGSGAFFGYYSTPDDIRIVVNAVSSPSYTSGAYVELNSSGQIVASSSVSAGSLYSSGTTVSLGEIQKTDGTRTRARINNDSLLFWNSTGGQKSEYSATGFYVDSGTCNGDLSVTYISSNIKMKSSQIWMHYPGGDINSFTSWTALIDSNWLPGPNPYTRWGIIRDGWAGYIEQFYSGNSYSSRTIVGASDKRVKDNILSINTAINPLEIVEKIEPKIYDYLHYKTKKLDKDGNATEEWNDAPKKFGFIAQDLIEILGEYKDLVTDEIIDPRYDFPIYATEDRAMIAILWGAVRDLSDKLKEIENK